MVRKPKDVELKAVESAVAESPLPESPTVVPPFRRRVRHYMQRFEDVKTFVWSKSFLFAGRQVVAGDPVDVALFRRDRLRRFWNAGAIQASPDWELHKARAERQMARKAL